MNTTFEFNTREEYKAQVAQWKAEYHQLSADIRAAREDFKKEQRSDKYAFPSVGRNLAALRRKANEALEIRKASKIKAQEQYLASRETQTC